jgi:Plavaka transposase
VPLSFRSGDALIDRLESLPNAGTSWKAEVIIPDSGTLLEPIMLFYRDPMDAIESLLQSPAFKDVIDFVPCRVWSDPGDPDNPDRRERNYKEIFSGNWSWSIQVSLAFSFSFDIL